MTNQELVYRICCAVAGAPAPDDGMDFDELFWFPQHDGSLVVAVNLSDTFVYACADCEEITEQRLELFERCCRDVRQAKLWSHYGLLFGVHLRQQRPLMVDRLEPTLRRLIEEAIQS